MALVPVPNEFVFLAVTVLAAGFEDLAGARGDLLAKNQGALIVR